MVPLGGNGLIYANLQWCESFIFKKTLKKFWYGLLIITKFIHMYIKVKYKGILKVFKEKYRVRIGNIPESIYVAKYIEYIFLGALTLMG